MKIQFRFNPRLTSAVFLLFIAATPIAQTLPLVQREPKWWTGETSSIWTGPRVNTDNSQPLNLGQLKHVVKMARGALGRFARPGAAIDQAVDGFKGWPGSPVEERQQNAQAVNVGQLKYLGDLFYARLHELGIDAATETVNRLGGEASLRPGKAYKVPWRNDRPASENAAIATIGQLKIVFGFELQQLDQDNDEIGDAYEWSLIHAIVTDTSIPNDDKPGGLEDIHPGNLEEYASRDDDGDELTNGQEFDFGTDMLNPDTDGDWARDGEEAAFYNQTDPLSNTSAPLTLCVLTDTVTWGMNGLPAHPPQPWDFPDPMWFDGPYFRRDFRNTTNRPGGLGGPLYSQVPELRTQSSAVSPPGISVWNMLATNPPIYSSASFREDGEGGAKTSGGNVWLRGPKSSDPVTLIYKVTSRSIVPPVPPLSGIEETTTFTTFTLPANSNLSAPQSFTARLSETQPRRSYAESSSISFELVPVEVVELAPKLKDETGTEISDSNKPVALPRANGMVEVDAANNRIAHRELKVSIGSALIGKKVIWSMEARFTPTGAGQPRFRGDWATAAEAHRNRFEASAIYGANAYRTVSQEQGETTVDANGLTAIRVNVPPWGLNKARIKIQIEGVSAQTELIDLEVPGVIVIDPGHGIGAADSSNAIGGSGGTTKSLEHEFALDIGTRMAVDLRRRRDADRLPVKIFMTRTGTGNLTFPDRTRVARENGCDIYVSIHFNAVDGVPLRRHPFGMWDSTGNHNLSQDQALAVRLRQALQRAISTVESAENRNAHTDGITSETHEANLQKGLDTCSDSTNNITPNYNGNIPSHTPCRAALMELEWMSNNRADLLFNDGNASLSETANRMREEAAQAMADAAIEDLYAQPAQ